MTRRKHHIDQLGRLVQTGLPSDSNVRMVRITGVFENNIYNARPLRFSDTGSQEFLATSELQVTNLAEPCDLLGQVPAGTDAIAVNVSSRWIVFIRQAGVVMFPAKIVSSQGGAVYSVREQSISAEGFCVDATGAINISATNLAEISLGSGAAMDTDTLVQITSLIDTAETPSVRYIFSHPCYAKYLS